MNRLKQINFTRFIFAWFSVLFFCYAVTIGINSFFRYTDFKVELSHKKNMKQQLKNKKLNINAQLEKLNTSSEWERLARMHLNMVHPNETAYLFYNQSND